MEQWYGFREFGCHLENVGLIRVPDHVLHEPFVDETIVVNLKSGHYFSIRGKSAKIWATLAQGMTEGELPTLFQNVDSAALDRLTKLLFQEGLVVGDEMPAERMTPEEWLAGTVLERSVERFTDVEGLLLLDPIHEFDQAGWPASEI